MSFLNQPYAVPSRVLVVFRTVLLLRPVCYSASELAEMHAPQGLLSKAESGRDMVEATIRECVKLHLLAEDAGKVVPHPKLPPAATDPATVERVLPGVIADLVFHAVNKENHDLALALSWFLAQNPYKGPANWSDAQGVLREQLGEGSVREDTGLTNADPYNLMEYWATYLGLARTWYAKGRERTTPDPTEFIRLRLPKLFTRSDTTRPLRDVMDALAKHVPVFEGGRFRERVVEEAGSKLRPPAGHLSAATALAWLRLRDEGEIVLEPARDARDALILPDGRDAVTVGVVRRVLKSEDARAR